MRVALTDWNWSGHHPTWFNHFTLALEELGHDVIAMCPDPDGASALADKTRAARASADGSRTRTVHAAMVFPRARFERLRPGRISRIDHAIRHFTTIERMARKVANDKIGGLDAIFHACVYDRDFEWHHCARPFLDVPWTGVYLHAMSYRMPGKPLPGGSKMPHPEKIFGHGLCRSLAILDEGIVSPVMHQLRKPVIALPDLPDNRQAEDEDDGILARDLARFANGRPIVGLFGHLMKSKGLFTFVKAATLPGARHVCFALGGEVLWPFNQAEAAWLRNTIEQSPNIWSHLERIPTEPALTRLMRQCDVLAAAYHDFPHSSGILAKAAAIHRPVIVSNGYLMAERVRRYRTGRIIPQANASALLEAVLEITHDTPGWTARCRQGWWDYLNTHSYKRFKACISEMLLPFSNGCI